MTEYYIHRSISFPLEVLKEIDWMCEKKNPERKFASRSDAVNKLMGMGLFLIKNEEKIESGELIAEMNGMVESEKTMEWLQTLSSMQREGLRGMIEMIDEGKQKRLIQ